MSIELSMKPVKRPEIEQEIIEDEILLYHPDTNKVHNLNGTAAFVWSVCNGEHSLNEMIESIHSQAPETDRQIIKGDVLDLIYDFRDEKLITTE